MGSFSWLLERAFSLNFSVLIPIFQKDKFIEKIARLLELPNEGWRLLVALSDQTLIIRVLIPN